MESRLVSLVACVALLSLWCGVGRATPMFYNMSMDGSGDEAGLELLFPTSLSTRGPAHVTAATGAPIPTNTITTTMIRLKDFVLTRVVDFLQDNMLIIIVVTSLLIVMVFIICCASAMSHKRKLEANKLPQTPPPKKHVADKAGGRKDSGELHERPYAVDHVKRVQTQSVSSPKNLRVPSKALVGERGRDVRSSPRPEVRRVGEAEEGEKRREEPKNREQPKHREGAQQSPGSGSGAGSGQPVCTCHLKKAHN